MALFPKNDPTTSAQQILARFLQKPAQNINCTLFTGGSEEDKVLWCLAAERRNSSAKTDKLPGTEYIIKLFNQQKPGTNEIAWTKLASDLGIGPKFHDADPAGAHMITAVAQDAPISPAVANTSLVVQNIAKSLATLHHAHAPFATASDMYERINAKYARLETSGALKDMLAQALQKSIAIKE